MFNYEFPPIGGGASKANNYILRELSKEGDVKVDLVTSSTDKFRIVNLYKNIDVHYLDIGKNGNLHFQSNKELLKYSFKAYKYAKKLIKTNKYDLIHAFFGIPCGYIAMKLKLPYIVSLRGSDVPFYNERFEKLDKLIFKRMSKKIWKNADFVVANSRGLKDLALSSSPNQEISVIYNGIDIEQFKPVSKNKKNKTITIISTGRLIPRKGYRYLIEALSGLDGFNLKLLGGGNSQEELEALAKKNNIDVEFTGKIDHEKISAYLQKADIFMLPSLNEGMSNSVLEAMACGLPVIATDVGGSSELIKNNGFIVKKADSEAIKEALLKYKKNQSLIKKHGDASRKKALSMSWANTAKEYKKLYQKIKK